MTKMTRISSSSSDVELFYFSSKAQNTAKLAKKLPYPSHDISKDQHPSGPFVLLLPTYQNPNNTSYVVLPVRKFLRDHKHLLIGVVGTGNKNFGHEYAIAADEVSRRCGVPIIHKVEYSGNPSDVEYITRIINQLKENTENDFVATQPQLPGPQCDPTTQGQ